MSRKKSRKFSKREKVGRFLFYSIILSFLPFLLSEVYNWWVGYGFNIFKPKYIPDFILITFAIVANVCSYATDVERAFAASDKLKRGFAGLAIISLVICTFFYILLLSTDENTLEMQMEVAKRASVFAKIAAGVLIANVLAGIKIELS